MHPHTASINCEILPLVLIALQANLKLVNGFVCCPERFDAVSAKIVRRVFQVSLFLSRGATHLVLL